MRIDVRARPEDDEDVSMHEELPDEGSIVVVTPGEVISTETGAFLRGHGTLRYGKLENGQFVAVRPSLVKRMKQHMVTLPTLGVDVILGTNGYLWISRSLSALGLDDAVEDAGPGSMETRVEVLTHKRQRHAATPMSPEDRAKIARVYRAVLQLNEQFRVITPDSILAVYHELERQDEQR
ncbi:hypothetical protein ATCC90586_000335 [Pythium insidiosum]|nr:hypothetical protein ATCC90586_000335 [Pythium insidiosum]